MNSKLYGPVAVDLNDGPVDIQYGHDLDGKPTARLVIGDLGQSIAISVTTANPDTVAELEAKVAELAAWTQRQQEIRSLPEVA
ncbi:MAG: hypothetical protein HOY76_18500 [Streptomyces sp.]|nr:hypothetical protein [Streptomyces sp.]